MLSDPESTILKDVDPDPSAKNARRTPLTFEATYLEETLPLDVLNEPSALDVRSVLVSDLDVLNDPSDISMCWYPASSRWASCTSGSRRFSLQKITYIFFNIN